MHALLAYTNNTTFTSVGELVGFTAADGSLLHDTMSLRRPHKFHSSSTSDLLARTGPLGNPAMAASMTGAQLSSSTSSLPSRRTVAANAHENHMDFDENLMRQFAIQSVSIRYYILSHYIIKLEKYSLRCKTLASHISYTIPMYIFQKWTPSAIR